MFNKKNVARLKIGKLRGQVWTEEKHCGLDHKE